MSPIDPRPTAQRPPVSTPREEQQLIQNGLLDLGVPLERARTLAPEAVQGLTFDPANGEPLYQTDLGAISGASGRVAVTEQLARRARGEAHGPDPLAEVLRRLEQERGVSPTDARPLLEHRIRRLEDGTVAYSASASAPPRVGGDELIELAVRQTYATLSSRRQVSSDEVVEADVATRHRFTI
jgi:hypothetical protein